MNAPKLLLALGWRKYLDITKDKHKGVSSEIFAEMMLSRKPQTEIARRMGVHRHTLRPIVESYLKSEQ